MKVFAICMALLFSVTLVFAQIPQQFSFQGVARKADGKVVVNAVVNVRITIHSETAGGTVVYQETHTAQTNSIGIFNIQIGGGSVVSGKFADIPWKTFSHFLQLEIDPLGGSTYTDLGTTQMLSVPYAIHAQEAARWNDGYPVVQKFDAIGPEVDINDPDVLNSPAYLKYTLPPIGNGTRLIWYPRKSAFRAGAAVNGKWEESELGDYSVAFGFDNLAKGQMSTALGISTSALGSSSMAAGANSIAAGNSSAAIGFEANAVGPSSVAVGHGTFSYFKGSFVAGMYNKQETSIDPDVVQPTDVIFQIGNGLVSNNRKSALTLTRNGNFGIGANVLQPEFLLDVGGRMRIKHNVGSTSGIFFDNSQNVADAFAGMKTDTQIGFFINGAWRFWIDNTGNGTLGGTLTQSSDRRLKRNFSPLSASLKKITGIQGYHYYWQDKDRDQSLQTGLIAQEVEALFPELVKTDKKGFKSLNYTGLIPHLIESMKELAKQNAKLEAENSEFRNDNKAIQDQLNKLASRIDQLIMSPPSMSAK